MYKACDAKSFIFSPEKALHITSFKVKNVKNILDKFLCMASDEPTISKNVSAAETNSPIHQFSLMARIFKWLLLCLKPMQLGSCLKFL